MHPIWFFQWCWEKAQRCWESAWASEGLFPLLERNQGCITLLALFFALWAFNKEAKRANAARAEAEEAERRRVEYAEAAREDQRSREEAQKLQAIVDARRADEARRLNHLLDFVTTANGIMAEVQREIVLDSLRLTSEGGESLLFPSERLIACARAASSALDAILPTAPPHPKAVLDARRAADRLSLVAHAPLQKGKAGIQTNDDLDKDLTDAKVKLSDHHREMMALLRPEVARALEIPKDTAQF